MSTPDFSALVARHRTYFRTGATRSAEWRQGQLTALRAMMTDRAEDYYAALWTDLRGNRTDADLSDVKYLATEADHALSHLRQWMKPLSISTPLVLEPARVQVQFDPLGWASSLGRGTTR
jgi:aldehyde dehydrogenase (NAD+)